MDKLDTNEVINEYYQELIRIDKLNEIKTTRILKVLENIKSKEWYLDLMEYSKESGVNHPFDIVRKTRGTYQEEEEYSFGGVWIEQSSSYPCEDCYYGTIYIKIDDKRYLEMPFEC